MDTENLPDILVELLTKINTSNSRVSYKYHKWYSFKNGTKEVLYCRGVECIKPDFKIQHFKGNLHEVLLMISSFQR